MIYDCFSFFNELDVLEIRLKALFNIVDFFVIAESHYTHTGFHKPLYFKENKKRFAPFLSKIIHVISTDPQTPPRANTDIAYRWQIENIQRNSTIHYIENRLTDNDTLIVSDIDEIPSPAAIRRAIMLKRPCRLKQKFYYYFLNYRCCTTPYWLRGSVVLSVGDFKNQNTYRSLEDGVALIPSCNVGPTATKVRFLKNVHTISNGGWHFSYVGGPKQIADKLKSIADGYEANNNLDYIKKCIDTGNDPYDRGEWYFAEALDKKFPVDLSAYPHLLYRTTPEYFKRIRFWRWFAYAKGFVRPLVWKLLPNTIVLKFSRFLNARQLAH